jgi:hypothetical protein
METAILCQPDNPQLARFVRQTGRFCRSGTADFAGLERQILPVSLKRDLYREKTFKAKLAIHDRQVPLYLRGWVS